MELWFVKGLAERNLKRLPNYVDLTQETKSPKYPLPEIKLQKDEEVIGIYENEPGELENLILVTNLGLQVYLETSWNMIKYQDIRRAHGPETKQEISGVTLELSDGRHVAVPVLGARDQFRDAYMFLQFLTAIIKKQASERQ